MHNCLRIVLFIRFKFIIENFAFVFYLPYVTRTTLNRSVNTKHMCTKHGSLEVKKEYVNTNLKIWTRLGLYYKLNFPIGVTCKMYSCRELCWLLLFASSGAVIMYFTIELITNISIWVPLSCNATHGWCIALKLRFTCMF